MIVKKGFSKLKGAIYKSSARMEFLKQHSERRNFEMAQYSDYYRFDFMHSLLMSEIAPRSS